jgi:hypothetical protein
MPEPERVNAPLSRELVLRLQRQIGNRTLIHFLRFRKTAADSVVIAPVTALVEATIDGAAENRAMDSIRSIIRRQSGIGTGCGSRSCNGNAASEFERAA